MVTKERIINALKDVYDPEIGRSIVELNMVDKIDINEGKVTIDIKLTIKGCPLQNNIKEDVIKKVSAIEGVDEVSVNMGAMTDEERQKLAENMNRQKKPIFEKTRVIVVGSGKGGVGKSTVSANLAVALGKLGYKVGLIDADVLGFSIPRLLGIVGERPYALDENTILPIEKYGIKVISMGNFADEDTPLIWRGPLLGGVLEQFMNDVYWGELDYMILDLPPGTGDIPLTIMQKIPEQKFLLVTTPQASASHVAGRIAYMAQKVNIDVIGITENMSYFECPDCHKRYNIFGEGETEKLAKELKTEILVKIPIDIKIREKSDIGLPIAFINGPEAEYYIELAKKVAEKVKPIR
ncbi:Mrp/NBP35 family ATP-binding protein [Thermoanaerobacterium sp. RBIITD]|uniref:Mrp/NBP35 family ATP-binding protein n=1 Tax=Thermoanaerobacterium sp. RBIITD TaxID=1550240 RepID=UPI000BB8E71E|nr:Mrp/NBP35 family ATP-binding protein [Thermoanaerobacterium sp. RBIITD]SNX53881.1 ATP-binding protein involved in chromosome partitioning [Thermoanaerobacterium sp. RBIITD]